MKDGVKSGVKDGFEELFQKGKGNPVIVLFLLTGAVFLFLKYLSPLLSPIITAMLFLTIFGPLLQKMERFHVHRQVGAVLILILAVAMILGIAWVLGGFAWNMLPRMMNTMENFKVSLPSWADSWIDNGLAALKKGALDVEKGLLGGAIRYSGKAIAFGGYFVTFSIAVILLARDYDEMMNKLLVRDDCHMLLSVICGVIRYIATYVKAQGVIMTVIALTCALALSLFGISQGALWGFWAGFLDALPFIGTGVILVPLAISCLVEHKVWSAVGCLCLYVVCIFLREMMEPRLIGKKMGVRPIAVLISLYAGIRIFGVPGIVKGPIGFIIIWETWKNLGWQKRTQDNE